MAVHPGDSGWTNLGVALAVSFVSSTPTIGAMGARTKSQPELPTGTMAGAATSSVATGVQLAIVVGQWLGDRGLMLAAGYSAALVMAWR